MFDLAEIHKAASADEAIGLLTKYPGARLIAGGTDVLVRLREGHGDYSRLIDIHDLAELKGVSEDAEGNIHIGANATFTDLIESPVIKARLPVLALAGSLVAGPQIQNAATIGGNICNGAPSADSAAPLLVHDAVVHLKGPGGERDVALENLYLGPGRVDVQPDEIMLGVRISKADHSGWAAWYHKYAMREAMDIATIGCAASVRIEDGRFAGFRLAYIVAGPKPLRCRTAEEAIQGLPVDGDWGGVLQELVLDDLQPRDSWRAAKDFRQHIIKTLAVRVTAEALKTAGVGKES